MKEAGRVVVLASDGAWSTRGYAARAFTYVVCNLTRDFSPAGDLDGVPPLPPVCYMYCIVAKRTVAPYTAKRRFRRAAAAVVDPREDPTEPMQDASTDAQSECEYRTVPVKGCQNDGNWTAGKGSAGMEGVAAGEFVKYMKEEKLMDGVQLLVTDGDLKLGSLMREHCTGVRHVHDPGHMYKKLRGLFKGLCTTKQAFEGLEWRMFTWLRRCHRTARLVTAKERDELKRNRLIYELMKGYLQQMVYHYHNLCDTATCPHACVRLVDGLIEEDTAAIDRVIAEMSQPPSQLGDDFGDYDLDDLIFAASHHSSSVSASFPSSSQPYQSPSVPHSQASFSSTAASSSSSPPPSLSRSSADHSDAELDLSVMLSNWADPSQYASQSGGNSSAGRGDRKRIRRAGRDPSEDSSDEDDTAATPRAAALTDKSMMSESSVHAGTDGPGRSRGRGRQAGGLDGARSAGSAAASGAGDALVVQAHKASASKTTQATEAHVAALDKNPVGRAFSDTLQQELHRRHERCVAAEARGLPRPYGTTSSAAGAEQKWRMWISMTDCDRRGRLYSKVFTDLVVATIFDEKLRSICHGYGTTHVESFNSQRSRFTPKDTIMPELFATRAQICVLNRNLGGVGWQKKLFEMMGLEWSERDRTVLRRSLFLRSQRDEINARKSRRRALAQRRKALAPIMRKIEEKAQREAAVQRRTTAATVPEGELRPQMVTLLSVATGYMSAAEKAECVPQPITLNGDENVDPAILQEYFLNASKAAEMQAPPPRNQKRSRRGFGIDLTNTV